MNEALNKVNTCKCEELAINGKWVLAHQKQNKQTILSGRFKATVTVFSIYVTYNMSFNKPV